MTATATPAPTAVASAPSSASPTGPAALSPPAAGQAGSTGAACRSAALRLSVPAGQRGAGNVHRAVRLTNTGPGCTLSGFPGVFFLDAAGRQLAEAVRAGGPAATVSLEGGASAYAQLDYSGAGLFPAEQCKPQQSSIVRVYPPGERAGLSTAFEDQICTGSVPQLHIGPMQAGTGPG